LHKKALATIEYFEEPLRTYLPAEVQQIGQLVEFVHKAVERQRQLIPNLSLVSIIGASIVGIDPTNAQSLPRLQISADKELAAKLDALHKDALGADGSLLRFWRTNDGSYRARINPISLLAVAKEIGEDSALASSWLKHLLFFEAMREALLNPQEMLWCPLQGSSVYSHRLSDLEEVEVTCHQDCAIREGLELAGRCTELLAKNAACSPIAKKSF
jgi:hypothetical protein